MLSAVLFPLASSDSEEGGGSAPLRVRDTSINLTWSPAEDEGQPSNVSVIGEWNSWAPTEMILDANSGIWSIDLEIDPGLYCYKFVINADDYRFDPLNPERVHCGAIENSLIRVRNHTRSTFSAEFDSISGLPNRILLHTGSDGETLMQGGPTFTDGDYPGAITYDQTTESWDIDLSILPDGKHTLHASGIDNDGFTAEDLFLPFWTGPQRNFVWDDALIYMLMTDRFVDGNASNNAHHANLSGVAQGAEWKGGDLAGVTQMIETGYFEQLGVNALWLTPLNTAANRTGGASDGQHDVSAYHGYWPIEPRRIDPGLGTEEELKAMVSAAHERGIRVLMDLVVNHVHEDHPYVTEHPDWFNDGCLCGTQDCDWTEHRLDCLFRSYMPDIDWTNREASEQMIDDALWWLEEFDLDGARIDAVKHVDDLAITNMVARVHDRFEMAGTDYFLKGETAMGWSGHSLQDNQEQYGTINRYMGEDGLDGQADFVLYHAVADNVFASGSMDYAHLDYWTNRSQDQYTLGSTMVPYVGSHDVPRFISRADDGTSDEWNQWVEDGLPGQPGTEGPYQAALQAYGWLLTTPGAPMLYYGDEYGEYGGADPDNRHMWRENSTWSEEEGGLAKNISELGLLRLSSEALRRGTYSTVLSQTDVLVYEMTATNETMRVILNRGEAVSMTGINGNDSIEFGEATFDGVNLSIPSHSVTVIRINGQMTNASVNETNLPISGCMDPLAENYDERATNDDDSCTYPESVVCPTDICWDGSSRDPVDCSCPPEPETEKNDSANVSQNGTTPLPDEMNKTDDHSNTTDATSKEHLEQRSAEAKSSVNLDIIRNALIGAIALALIAFIVVSRRQDSSL